MQEEVLQIQRAKIKWLKEGNLNTTYFHKAANGRLIHNNIFGIRQKNEVLTD